MMKKINILMSVMCLFTVTLVNGQGSAINIADIKGSPYVAENYTNGVIYYADRKHTAPIRYNAFQDLIEYQQSGRPLVLDPSETIKKICFGEFKFVPQKYEFKGKPKLGYLAMLDSGKVILYSKKQVTFLPARKGGALDGSDQPAEFKKTSDIFFYKIGEGPLLEVENIKTMIASFPDKQEELSEFAKKEKISPRREKEIIQFVKYYNSL